MPEQLPIWQAVGTEPTIELQTNGWQPGMKPSAQHMNWLFNRAYKCIEELQGDSAKITELQQTLSTLQQTVTTNDEKVTEHLADFATFKNNMGIANVKDFGAKGDGVTDDTVAIRSAIASLTRGGILYFPEGDYIVGVQTGDTGNYIFKIDKPTKIIGAGFISAIRLKSDTPNTKDLFYVSPNMIFGGEFYGVHSLLLYPLANTSGRYAFHFDVSQSGQVMNKFYMSDVYIAQHGSNAIRVTNAENKADGFFASTFERCVLVGGVDLERSGDSIVFRDCTITGRGRGVRVKSVNIPSQFNYASQFILDNCNITSDGGALLVEFAKNISVIGGNIEQTKLLNGAVIEVSGSDGQIVNFNMERTHLTVFGNSGSNCDNVQIRNANHVDIDKCVFANETGGTNIVIEVTARNVVIGKKNVFESGNQIEDNGIGTAGVIKKPILLNSWTNYNETYYSTTSYTKDESNIVCLKGILKDGITVAGTAIFEIEEGFRPSKITQFFVIVDVEGVLNSGVVQITPEGQLQAQNVLGNTRLSLDGITYLAEQ